MSLDFCFLLVAGPVEADPEYRLIVAANNLTVEIDNELSKFAVPVIYYFKCLLCKSILLCITDFPNVLLHTFRYNSQVYT